MTWLVPSRCWRVRRRQSAFPLMVWMMTRPPFWGKVNPKPTLRCTYRSRNSSCSSLEPIPYRATGRAALSSEVEIRATHTVSASAQTASTTASWWAFEGALSQHFWVYNNSIMGTSSNWPTRCKLSRGVRGSQFKPPSHSVLSSLFVWIDPANWLWDSQWRLANRQTDTQD